MSSQFRFPSLQKRRLKNIQKKKSGVHQNQMGVQGLKTHNVRVTDVISQVITVMQQYFLPTERAQDFITMSHQSHWHLALGEYLLPF